MAWLFHIMQKILQTTVIQTKSDDMLKRKTSSQYCSWSTTNYALRVDVIYNPAHHTYECSGNLRGNLMHDLGGGVFQRVLQVVLEVAEELAGASLHHIQQSSTITGIHI